MTGSPGWPTVDAACHALLAAGFAEASRLARAPNSAVYRVTLPPPGQPRSVIVKLYAGPARWKATKEHQVITVFAECSGFGVPEVLASGPVPGTDVSALILEDLGTVSLREAVCRGDCSRGEALGLLGQLLAIFHRTPHPPPGTGQPIGASTFAEQMTALRRRLPDQLRAATSATLDRAVDLTEARARVWCHGDLHLDNVVLLSAVEGRVPFLVDFEETTLAVAEYDLAQTTVTTDAIDVSNRSSLIAGYETDLSDELLTHLIVFQALRGWLYAAVRENRDVVLWRTRLNLALNQYAGLV